MGVATLLVLIIHGSEFKWPEAISDIGWKLSHEGRVGVDMFLFLSGIGLYFSLKGRNSILEFYKRRFIRIIPTYLIIAAPLYAIVDFILESRTVSDYIIQLSSIAFWIPELHRDASWYVAFIIPLYFLYPAFYFCTEHSQGKRVFAFAIIISASMLLDLFLITAHPAYYAYIDNAIARLPIFITGCYAAHRVYEKQENKKILPTVLLSITFYLLIRLFSHKYINEQNVWYHSLVLKSMFFLTLAIVWAACLLFKSIETTKIGNKILKILSLFGRYSFEIYIAHRLIIKVYKRLPLSSAFPQFWVYYLGIVPLSVALAVGARQLATALTGFRPHK